MIPANIEAINDLRGQDSRERMRILLSFVNEYITDESRFCGPDAPGVEHPIQDFILLHMKDNQLDEPDDLYHWGMPIRKLKFVCPDIFSNLMWLIDTSWTWCYHMRKVDLSGLYTHIYEMAEETKKSYTKRIRVMLKKKGYILLGSGVYSEVWGKPDSEWVYKINKGEDDGWCEYVVWATSQGYNTTYAPRVHSPKKFKGFYIAKMEKLKQTISEFKRDPEFTASPHAAREFKWFETARDYALRHDIGRLSRSDRNHIEAIFPGLIDFFENMLKYFNGAGSLDLHDGNFMIDNHGFLVVTDPVVQSCHSGSTSPRIKHGRVVEQLAA